MRRRAVPAVIGHLDHMPAQRASGRGPWHGHVGLSALLGTARTFTSAPTARRTSCPARTDGPGAQANEGVASATTSMTVRNAARQRRELQQPTPLDDVWTHADDVARLARQLCSKAASGRPAERSGRCAAATSAATVRSATGSAQQPAGLIAARCIGGPRIQLRYRIPAQGSRHPVPLIRLHGRCCARATVLP